MHWQQNAKRWGPLALIVASFAFAIVSVQTARNVEASGNEYRTIGMVAGTYSHRTGAWHNVGLGGDALDLRQGDNVAPDGNATKADAPVYFQIKHISGSDTTRVYVFNYPGSCTGYRFELKKLSTGDSLGLISTLHISKATLPSNFDLAKSGSWNVRYVGDLLWNDTDPGAPSGPDNPETCAAWSGSHLHQEGNIGNNDPFPVGTYTDFNVSLYSTNWLHKLEY